MATQFSSNFNDTLPFSDTTASYALAATTELTYTVPGTNGQKYRAEFSYQEDSEVWVALNETAQIPTPATMHSDRRSVLNPKVCYVSAGDVIHFISGAIAVGSVSLLSIPG